MATIRLHYTNGIHPPLRVEEGQGPFPFKQPLANNNMEIALEVSARGDAIESTAESQIRDDLASRLSKTSDPDDVKDSDQEQLRSLFSPLLAAHRRLLALILQELLDRALQERSVGQCSNAYPLKARF